MAKLMSSPGQCFANCSLLFVRLALFLVCLVLFAAQIAYTLKRTQVDSDQSRHGAGKEPLDKFVLYSVSVFLMGVSTMGACGAITRDPRTLKVFAVLLSVGCLIQGAGVFMKHRENKQDVSKFNITMRHLQQHYNWDESELNAGWDFLQSKFECCGLIDQFEWLYHPKKPSSQRYTLPDSCCPSGDLSYYSSNGPCQLHKSYSTGCLERYEKHLSTQIVLGVMDIFVYLIMISMALYVAKPRCSVDFSSNVANQQTDKSQAYVIANVSPPPVYSDNQLI